MRKVLSLVLILALVLGSFSMAFAADTSATGLSDVAGNANEDAINVAYNLGIVTGNPDGTFLPAKEVNRAEFAAMITRALGIPESALAGYTSTSFKDTTGYGWAIPYLAFCNSKGIMLGDGNGNAMPARTINMNEAMTMVLRAVGYTENSADLVGTWPSNYVTKAQDLDLYKDVLAATNVDKAAAAQIIYNALPIHKVSVAADGRTTEVTQTVWDSTIPGWVAVPVSMLTSGLNCTSDKEVVDYDDDALINTTDVVGTYGEVYRNDKGEIVAVKKLGEALTGKLNNGLTKFKVNGVEYTIGGNISAAGTMFDNFVNMEKQAAATNLNGIGADNEVTLSVDVTGKTIKDIYAAQGWVVTNAEKVDSGVQQDITDKTLCGYDFAKTDDGVIDVNSYQLVGVKALTDIADGNIVYVYTKGNAASGKIVKVAVGTEIVTGAVTKANDTDNEYTVAGTVYKNAGAGCSPASTLSVANVTDDVKVWLDAYGKIWKVEVTKGAANNYAVVANSGAQSGFDAIIKLVNAEGTSSQYSFDGDYDGMTTAAIGSIAAYSLDKAGKIDNLTTAGLVYAGAGTLTVNTNALLNAGGTAYAIDSAVVVWTYEGAAVATSSDYKLSAIAKLDKNAAYAKDANLYVKDGKVKAILVSVDNATKSDSSIYAVVKSATLTTNAAGDKAYEVVGFGNGASFDKLTSNETKGTPIAAAVATGTDVVAYKFDLDSDDAISKATAMNNATFCVAGGGYLVSDGGIVVTDAAVGWIDDGATKYPLSDKVKYYQVKMTSDGKYKVDSYAVFTGSVRKGNRVWLYDHEGDKPTDEGFGIFDTVVIYR